MIIMYKGYIGYVTHDRDESIYHGEVIGLDTMITFWGHTIEETRIALKDSVEVYLDWCIKRGIKPEKTYSGDIHLRVKPSLHKALALKAAKQETSINQILTNMVNQSLHR